MPNIKKTIVINQPIDDVWAAISDFSRLPDWNDQITSVETLGTGKGQRIDFEVHTGNDSVMQYAFVTQFNEPHRLAYQYNSRAVTWEIRYDLEPDGANTQLTRRRVASGILGWVIWWRIKADIEAQERAISLRIKHILDNIPMD